MVDKDSLDETESFGPDIESQQNGSDIYSTEGSEQDDEQSVTEEASSEKNAESNMLSDDKSDWEFVDHPDPDSPDEKELGMATNKFSHAIQFFTRGHAIPWKALGIIIVWTALITTLSWLAGRKWSKNTGCRWWVSFALA